MIYSWLTSLPMHSQFDQLSRGQLKYWDPCRQGRGTMPLSTSCCCSLVYGEWKARAWCIVKWRHNSLFLFLVYNVYPFSNPIIGIERKVLHSGLCAPMSCDLCYSILVFIVTFMQNSLRYFLNMKELIYLSSPLWQCQTKKPIATESVASVLVLPMY
jgi:hypothetical protein